MVFGKKNFTVLVATDVASRRLDIPNVDLVIHYELPNDPETFVHRSGRTGHAGKEGAAILMFANSQRRTVRSLEHDVGSKFEFISPPTMADVLGSSADQVVATLRGVHPESVEFFTPTAQKLIDEQGARVPAAALAQLSSPPLSRSLVSHEQGWITLQLTRDPSFSRGFISARSVTGFLSDVYPTAADEVGKIYIIADERVQGAVFDLPQEIAKELLTKQTPPGNTKSKSQSCLCCKMMDLPPAVDNYGRFSNNREGGGRGGSWERGFRSYWGGGSSRFSSDDGDEGFGRGGQCFKTENSWSRNLRSSGNDWPVGSRSSRSSGSRDRGGYGGSCFTRGRPGHKSADALSREAISSVNLADDATRHC